MGRIFKKTTALLLVGMMIILSAASCTDSEDTKEVSETEPEPSVVSTSETEESEPADPMSEEMIKKIKDKIAEEAAKTDHKIDILFWDRDALHDINEDIINDFIKKFKDDRYQFNIKLTPLPSDTSSFANAVLTSSEESADVFGLTEDEIEMCVKEKVLAPVDEFYEYYVSNGNTENSVKTCTIDGTTYAFPRNVDEFSLILYYDKRIFKEDEVGNINEMIQKAAENNRSIYWAFYNEWYSTPVFLTSGCELTNDNGKLLFDADEGLNAAKAMCEIAKYGENGFDDQITTSSDSTRHYPAFQPYLNAAAIYSIEIGATLRNVYGEENIGAAKLPVITINGKEKQLEAFGGYDMLGVNAQTKYPFTAQTLAYYLTEKNTQLKLYEKFNKIPVNKEVLQSDSVKDDPAIKAFEEQLPYYHPMTTGVNLKYWSSGANELCADIIKNKGNISDEKLKEQLKNIQLKMS